jgi:heme-degrading monooxygenase HmoA
MSTSALILRRWTGRIRSEDEADYVAYIERTGLSDYARTPGNLGAQMLMRTLEDGVSEVTTLSWWASEAAIRAFVGEDFERAKYYPEDERFLVDRPRTVDHFRIVAAIPEIATRAG